MAINAIKNSGGSAKLKKLYIYTERSSIYGPNAVFYQPMEVDYIKISSGSVMQYIDGNNKSHSTSSWGTGVHQIDDTVKSFSGINIRAEVYLK